MRQFYSEEECTLCLGAYIKIRDLGGSYSVSEPIVIELKNYLDRSGMSSRSIDSLVLRIDNYRYQDTGTGCHGISETALRVWKSYLDKDGKIDTDRLMMDCDNIREIPMNRGDGSDSLPAILRYCLENLESPFD